MNQVFLTGNLTRDPDLRKTLAGTPVCNLSVATHRRVKKGDVWEDETAFVDVAIWGARGEAFSRNHKKGDKVGPIQGHLKFEEWDDNGQKRSRLKVVCDDWEFAGTERRSESSEQPPADKGPF